MKLYTFLGSTRGNKILVASEYVNVNIQPIYVSFDQIKEPEFLKKNPNGKIPVLETENGFLYESNAILRYIGGLHPSKSLLGCDCWAQAQVNQWLDWCSNELNTPLSQLIYVITGWSDAKNIPIQKAYDDLLHVFKILDKHLKLNTFLVGNNITLADIAIASSLVGALRYIFEPEQRKQFISVMRWFETCSSQVPFKKVWGRIFLCQKSFLNLEVKDQQNPVKEDKQPSKEVPKPVKNDQPKQKETKGAQKQQQQQQKESKKEVKKTEVKEAHDEEAAPIDKEKSSLASLPPSSFDLYNFKTLFVNAQNKQEAIDYLWNNYDAEGYSLYHVHYIKAEGEGKVLFLTNNLKNGFLQRLDHFRKYAFGVHGVYGEEPNLEIRGVWLWRGVGIPNEIKELDQYEYHTWNKLDHTNENDKNKLKEYWTGLNEGDMVDDLIARDVRYFK